MAGPIRKLRNKVAALRAILTSDDPASPGLTGLVRKMTRTRTRALRLRAEVRRLHGPPKPPGGAREVVVLCSVRDGMEHLPHFLQHHRTLGVAHFVFLDNASVDGTTAHLSNQPDVTLYSSRLPYAQYKHHFKRFLFRAAGRDRWTLLADTDECFDFPGSDALSLSEFCEYLDAHGHTAVVAHMLDRFSDAPILRVPEAPDGDLAALHRFYDLSGLHEDDHAHAFGASNTISDPAIKCLSCGFHRDLFGNDLLVTKHPLVRWAPPMELPKYSHDISYARIADVSAVLYHFKFTAGFFGMLQRAVREANYYLGSERYKRIAEALQRDPELSLVRDTTRAFTSVDALVDAGFLRVSAAYRTWLDQRRERR
jgi:hypothetical protein